MSEADWADEVVIKIANRPDIGTSLHINAYVMLAQALRDERERCARIVEEFHTERPAKITTWGAKQIAERIRSGKGDQ